jgi:hypothetical protein
MADPHPIAQTTKEIEGWTASAAVAPQNRRHDLSKRQILIAFPFSDLPWKVYSEMIFD